VQNEVNQKESEHKEIDGMKKLTADCMSMFTCCFCSYYFFLHIH